MLRRSAVMCVGNPLAHLHGYWPEDHKLEYDTMVYYPRRYAKAWYAAREIKHARKWLADQQRQESVNAQNGLEFNGDGPFEREMKRKGIQVEKYRLPTTTATKRLHEMVVLRRKHIETLAKEKMAAVRSKLAREEPSGWYDEAAGPLNQHFLASMQIHYKRNIVELPAEPVVAAAKARQSRAIDTEAEAVEAL